MFNQKLNRRSFLSGATGLGMLPFLPRLVSASSNGNPKRVVLIRAYGGWDVTYCLDPKLSVNGVVDGPDSHATNNGLDVESIQTYGSAAGNGGINVMVNNEKRPNVDAFFSDRGEQCIAVNGIYVGSIVHDLCRLRMSTGYRDIGGPDMGVIAGVEHGQSGFSIPFLDISGSGFSGDYSSSTGQLGTNNQILALLDRSITIPGEIGSGQSYPTFVPSGSQRQSMTNFFTARQQILNGQGHTGATSSKRLEDLEVALLRRQSLLDDRSLLLDNLTFGNSGSFNSQVNLAATLLNSGFCQSIALDAGDDWDSHDNITDQNAMYDDLFAGLSLMTNKLEENGMLDDTLIVVISEMTRTPRLNSDGGKDHWPVTSALVVGGGLDGGKVLGSTDDSINPIGINLSDGSSNSTGTTLNYDQFVAGIVHASGADAAEWMPNVEVLHGFVD